MSKISAPGKIAEPLWIPSRKRIEEANVTRFIEFVNEKHSLEIGSYEELYVWSIEQIADFWASMWEFGEIVASHEYDMIVSDLSNFPGARWFLGARLNFAQNLLRYKDDRVAIMFRGENQKPVGISFLELRNYVARLAGSLRDMGVGSEDRVAAYMPNLMETTIAMLATTSIGGTWASCGVELGPTAVLERLNQIEPKVLFTVSEYSYKGEKLNVLSNVEKISRSISALEKVIVLPYLKEEPDIGAIPKSVLYDDFISQGRRKKISFEQLSFDHPVYIMFSSGTTGKPKCMVQGAGGVLINHLKELILHTDLKREDRILYLTSPSWMMWNWLVSSLAVGATVVLYDGSPNYPDWSDMWRFVQDEKITIFGCSATYINHLRIVGAKPSRFFDLSSLKEISQTGSALSAEGFRYVYRDIKEDLHFNSISGGTDINGCFAIGTPIQPVYAGELQGPALGMKVSSYDEMGRSVVDQPAELVCELPSPSMPLYFWNDTDGKKFRDAYFGTYPQVWRHGDLIMIHRSTGGITFLGRSDSTLKPSGVRIGPAEFYNVLERFKEIADSVVVGQDWKGDQRIVLFIKLESGFQLSDNLKNRIKRTLREEASPRHIPALIIEAPDVPYTLNMKKVESAVSNIIHGKPVTNRDALANPESLIFYERILPELRKRIRE